MQLMDGSSISKLATGVEILKCLFTFLFYAGSKRRPTNILFFFKSFNLFYILKVPQNAIHSKIEKHNNKYLSIFDTNFNI